MAEPKITKPTPISTCIVCSSCGLNWEEHGEKPTLEDCVRLLKAEVARRPTFNQQIHGTSLSSPTQQFFGNTC